MIKHPPLIFELIENVDIFCENMMHVSGSGPGLCAGQRHLGKFSSALSVYPG